MAFRTMEKEHTHYHVLIHKSVDLQDEWVSAKAAMLKSLIFYFLR